MFAYLVPSRSILSSSILANSLIILENTDFLTRTQPAATRPCEVAMASCSTFISKPLPTPPLSFLLRSLSLNHRLATTSQTNLRWRQKNPALSQPDPCLSLDDVRRLLETGKKELLALAYRIVHVLLLRLSSGPHSAYGLLAAYGFPNAASMWCCSNASRYARCSSYIGRPEGMP